jgi:hypothetical protein
MANGNTTTPATPTTTSPPGGTESQSYLATIRKQAAETRKVGTPDIEAAANIAGRGLKGTRLGQAAGAYQQYEQDVKTTKKEAGKAAAGLEMAGEATDKFMRNLEGIQGRLTTQIESSKESWGAAAEKADEYVSAARGRVGEVLGKIDEINSQIAKDRDFSKAHSMQAAVQATLGSMKAEERNIMETYGTESKEYQQFVESKRTALATVQSNIHATYQQFAEQQGQTYLNATADAMTKSNMYLGFQEQQHVEMLKYKEASKNAYDLQVAQFQVGVEQLKMAGMENLANWIIETPTFSMDSTPLLTLIGDLAQTQKASEQAYDLANPPTRRSGEMGPTTAGARAAMPSRMAEEQSARSRALY